MPREQDTTKADYYRQSYSRLQRSGLQGFGNSLLDWFLIRELRKAKSLRWLELGASSGEFTQKLLPRIQFSSYLAVDLEPGKSNPQLHQDISKNKALTFLKANAEHLPLQNNSADVTFSTCLLAHVQEPQEVMKEALRVTSQEDGLIVFAMPTDPGLLNQFAKRIVTYPTMRRMNIPYPEYIYAIEHRNPVHNLIAIGNRVFGPDLKVRYFPGIFPGWNLNLVALLVFQKRRFR